MLDNRVDLLEGVISISQHLVGTFYFPQAFIMPKGLRGAIMKWNKQEQKYDVDYKYPAGTIVPANEPIIIATFSAGDYPVKGIVSDLPATPRSNNDLYSDFVLEGDRYKTTWNGTNEYDD